MRNLIWSIGVSLDGYVAGPGGEIDWAAPDEELHRFHNEQTRELSAHLCGRALYETMLPWESAEREGPGVMQEFAAIWQALPKIVFSRTLTSVQGNARLASGSLEDELAALDGDVAVGGAGLAAQAIRRGLVDDFRLFVSPVILGGGTPYFPPLPERVDLELHDTQTFGAKVVYLRFARAV